MSGDVRGYDMYGEIRLLGPVVVRNRCGDVVEDAAWRTAKTFDLLRVLALAEGAPVSTDVLLDLFWPTADPARGRSSLRTAACQIRKVLGQESIARVGNGLALAGVRVDTADYRALAAQVDQVAEDGHPATVVRLVRETEALYAGDLEVGGSDCVPLHEARTELRELRVRLLLLAAEAAANCAAWLQSLGFAEQAAAIETSDRCTRALMRAWFAIGETAKPVEEFERLRRHLADEYGLDPAPQTRALYLELVSACDEWPPRSTTIGREDQVREVATAITARLLDSERPGSVVWLVGKPGSGRDTVARDAAAALMLPLAQGPGSADSLATVELLPDQGQLTDGLASTLRRRAQAWGRVLLVPVTDAGRWAMAEHDTLVTVPPLHRSDFRQLLTLTLQGRPTPRLETELYERSGGLPGVACTLARQQLHGDTLVWTPTGVDASRRAPIGARLRTALALLPVAFMDMFGALGGESAQRDRLEERLVASHGTAVVETRRQDGSGWSIPETGRRVVPAGV